MSYREVSNPLNHPDLERDILSFWEENAIFEKSISTRPEEKPFIFYEGPPTANGKPGIHHVISRCIKDFACRYHTMLGYRVDRKAGWDTHGLPVEIEVEKELGFETKDQIEAYGIDRFNKKCRESVFRYLKEWTEFTRRIGYWIDLDDAYVPYTNEYIETVWYLLAELWKKGFLYQGFKILPYCSRCETALSSHEISLGYREVTDRSITAKFPLVEGDHRYILAWTTTPWTLPGNVALAVGADILYAEVEQEIDGRKEIYYIAENRLDELKEEYRILRIFPGSEMEGWKYRPLFDFVDLTDDDHSAYFVSTADFVTTEEGTGVVHTAVMYGEDDYQLGMRIGLPAKHTVDEQGCFNELVPRWTGRYVKDLALEDEIVAYLKDSGRLYSTTPYTHAYPHCWRCHSPLLYYAKRSWYIRTTQIKEELQKNNAGIEWYPKEVGEGRFGQWLENNVDWALSRDRYWGTPLNIWICQECAHKQAIESAEMLKSLSGLSEIEDLHKPVIDEIHIPCGECEGDMVRTPEVIDVWFDSGAMPYGQMHYPFDNVDTFEKNFPADFIAEGVDQTRGWFYSLLAISTLISGISCYKRCMSIEMILDKDGQKMSKSKGNAVEPFQIFDKEGADALRWYLFTVSPPWVPTRFDRDGIKEVLRKFFGTLTNTYSFFTLYANIDNFSYDDKPIPLDERPEIDRWLVSTLNTLVRRVRETLSRYEVTKATRAIQDFVIDDLSNWYVRLNRRRFWKAEMGSDKLAAYQTLFEALFTLAKLIAPFAPFVSEEMYRNLNSDMVEPWESVHLASYPDSESELHSFQDTALEESMHIARSIVSLCRAARNEAGIKVRQPLAKTLVVVNGKRQREALQTHESMILEEVNVHALELVDDSGQLLVKRAKPIFKQLGPKFGSHVNQAADIIRNFSPDEINTLLKDESIRISMDKGKHGDVTLEDVEIVDEAAEGMAVQSDSDLTVALDTVLDDNLIAEGLAREFVSRVQNMRKEAGFQVTDRIKLRFEASDRLGSAIKDRENHIMEEVLAVSIEEGFENNKKTKVWAIDDDWVRLIVERQS